MKHGLGVLMLGLSTSLTLLATAPGVEAQSNAKEEDRKIWKSLNSIGAGIAQMLGMKSILGLGRTTVFSAPLTASIWLVTGLLVRYSFLGAVPLPNSHRTSIASQLGGYQAALASTRLEGKHFEMNGAQERTRTSTTVRPLAPEAISGHLRGIAYEQRATCTINDLLSARVVQISLRATPVAVPNTPL